MDVKPPQQYFNVPKNNTNWKEQSPNIKKDNTLKKSSRHMIKTLAGAHNNREKSINIKDKCKAKRVKMKPREK